MKSKADLEVNIHFGRINIRSRACERFLEDKNLEVVSITATPSQEAGEWP